MTDELLCAFLQQWKDLLAEQSGQNNLSVPRDLIEQTLAEIEDLIDVMQMMDY